MINIETIKFVKMLDKLAELTEGGILEFEKATEDNCYSKVFYDQEAADDDGNYRVVLGMCIMDNPECFHHDVISYYDSDANEFSVRAAITEDAPYLIVKLLTSEEVIVIEDGCWYFT